MNTVRPRPYPQKGNGNYNAGNTGTDKDGRNNNHSDQQQQPQRTIARGRADGQPIQEPVQETRQAIYSPANNAYPQTQTYKVNTPPPIRHSVPISNNQIGPMQYQSMQAQNGYQPLSQNQPVQTHRPLASKTNNVNIAQIIKDFRNTIKAIATPPEIVEQVEGYLAIVNKLVQEPQPQVNLIQTNLKTAASLLDKYISETLNKDSKVVQNWLDALFLQKINYTYDEEEVNPNFLVNFPDNNHTTEQPQEVQNNQVDEIKPQEQNTTSENVVSTPIQQQTYEPISNNNDVVEFDRNKSNIEQEYEQAKQIISKRPNITIVPQDTRLKSLFVEAKKQAFSNNPQKAMKIFKEAFTRAAEINDNETQSRICLEIGKIYDDNDHVVQALNSYNRSLQYTTDTNVKSRAHYSMAQIYDDVNEVEPALNHYLTSISYAGKSDDLIGQSDSLTRVANIFADKYNEEAFEYFDIARKLVEQTSDSSMKGYVLSNTADACVQFRKNDKALKYYAEAVRNYEKTNEKEEIAQNYKAAAEIMIEFNNPNKAKSLLKKALINAVKTKNEDLIAEINAKLVAIE